MNIIHLEWYIYIYISICSKFFLLPILHQWNETVKDRPGERSLCYKEILSSLLVPSTNFQNFWSKSLDNFMESQTHNIFIPSKRLSNTFPFPIHISLSLISHSVPLFDDSLNENERIIEGTEREDNTEESRPVIDELSRRVIRGERIGEDSRFTLPSPPSSVIIINRGRWYLAEYQSRNVGRLFVGGDNRNPRPRTDYVYDRCKRTRVNRYTDALWSIAKDTVYTGFIYTGC